MDLGLITGISRHAVQRMIQRAGARSIEDLVSLIGVATNWIGVCQTFEYQGSFMVPTPAGMICCGTVLPFYSASGAEAEVKGALIKTFIGLEQMTDRTRNRWEMLMQAVEATRSPRVTRLRDNLKDDYAEAFKPAFPKWRVV